MKIYLNEITDQDTKLVFTQAEKWVVDAVERVDEHIDLTEFSKPFFSVGNPSKIDLPPREIGVHFSLRKVDEVIVVSGKIMTHVELVCSRCANPFHLECRPSFSALFCNDPSMAGVAYLQGSGKPSGQNQGVARHAHDDSPDSNRDLDITYLSHDYIDLGDVLTEQLQFQVPFQPLCKEACKGICCNCGTDLNKGKCACSKIIATNPFSALQGLKI